MKHKSKLFLTCLDNKSQRAKGGYVRLKSDLTIKVAFYRVLGLKQARNRAGRYDNITFLPYYFLYSFYCNVCSNA